MVIVIISLMRKFILSLLFIGTLYPWAAAPTHQLSLLSHGARLGNYKKYDFNLGYKHQNPRTFPSIGYQFDKGKWGMQVSGLYYDFQYVPRGVYPSDTALYYSIGFYLHASLKRKLLKWNTGSLSITGGLSSKVSYDDIILYFIPLRGGGIEAIGDNNASEVSGLALNTGFNFNQKIYGHLHLTSNIRFVQFIVGADYQRTSFWTEFGLGWRFRVGKKELSFVKHK